MLLVCVISIRFTHSIIVTPIVSGYIVRNFREFPFFVETLPSRLDTEAAYTEALNRIGELLHYGAYTTL